MIFIGGLLGFLAVALGAYAQHGLKATLTADAFDSVSIAINYQLLHAIIITVIGLFIATGRSSRWLQAASMCFIAGLLLFCGGIYTAHILDFIPGLRLAPVGGTVLMLGWLALAGAGVSVSRRS